MGSRFIQTPSSGGGGIFGNNNPDKVWMQFVPGTVIQVMPNQFSAGYSSPRDVNTIIAQAAYGEPQSRRGGVTRRYIPLLRGIVDCPEIGDPVLLATFGGIDYYIGPINTTNSPNWNENIFQSSDKGSGPTSNIKSKGESKNFRKIAQGRLQKMFNPDLDGDLPAKGSIHGDMLFEGRHGNSIRIGSRDINPYIFLSNGREPNFYIESAKQGSVVALTKRGSIRQHFAFDAKMEGEDAIQDPFILSSDHEDLENPRLIGDQVYNYNFGSNEDPTIDESQVFMNASRITINSRRDSIFLSSFKNIHIGTGEQFIVQTKKETIIEAGNIFLGKSGFENRDDAEPLVMGLGLQKWLQELCDLLKNFIVTTCVGGMSGPPNPTTLKAIRSLEDKIAGAGEMFSEYHFIEKNGTKKT
tara:strand:+ start:2083 stop:3318 length:1236 start_codon:yes stop_codon:yes gene_type:complete